MTWGGKLTVRAVVWGHAPPYERPIPSVQRFLNWDG